MGDWQIFLVITTLIIWLPVWMLTDHIKQVRRRQLKRKHDEQVEIEEDYLWQYGYSKKECDECHLPGDCPLCGAD